MNCIEKDAISHAPSESFASSSKRTFCAALRTLALVVGLVFAGAPASALTIDAGIDVWETLPGTTSFDFNELPIPPDFFDPGSDPFVGRVNLQGQPLESDSPTTSGNTDTIVRRLDPAVLPSPGDSDTVPVELVALSLTSVQPITVTYGGTTPEQWDVFVGMTSAPTRPQGQMTINLGPCGNGGTFEAVLPVQPRIVFFRPSDSALREIDLGLTPGPIFDQWTYYGNWSVGSAGANARQLPAGIFFNHDSNPDTPMIQLPGSTANFFPGLQIFRCGPDANPCDRVPVVRSRVNFMESKALVHGMFALRVGDNPEDYDNDGIPDELDNCPYSPNPSQWDHDGDGVGDACDNCEQYNPCQEDCDQDGIGGACELQPRTNLPDNGNGSADLPNGRAVPSDSPRDVFIIRNGLPEGSTIEATIKLRDMTITSLDESGTNGGFDSFFDVFFEITFHGTGALAGFDKEVAFPGSGEFRTNAQGTQDHQSFDAEFFRLEGELFADSDFESFDIRAGADLGLPSPGHVTLTRLPSGSFAVDSFFDITYEIEFVGNGGTVLDGMASIDRDVIRERFFDPYGKPLDDDCNGNGIPDDCDVTGQHCVAPDNGFGTAELPAGCSYQPPTNDDFVLVDGLPTGSEIHLKGPMRDIIYLFAIPGGELGGEFSLFDALFHLKATGTGDFADYERDLILPITGELHSAPRAFADPRQSFPTDFFFLEGDISGDPDFDLLRIESGIDYGMPSPGMTTLTQLPSGQWAVDSFFDITYTIEFQGAAGGPFDGMAGTTTGQIRLHAVDLVEPPLSDDCNGNGIPDECEPDCNENGIPDDCDIASGFSQDCNNNGVPDECDINEPICVAPDNGTGTTDLPAPCPILPVPPDAYMIVDGLPPGTTIEGTGPMVLIPGVSSPGGILGGDVNVFTGSLDINLVGTGGLSGFNRNISLPVGGATHSAPRVPGDPVQDFDEYMYHLEGELFGDPDFCTFRVRMGQDFGLPSPGHTTLTQLPGGDFQVDSFFDVTYEIEFQGCPGSVLDGFSGTTTGTVRIQVEGVPGNTLSNDCNLNGIPDECEIDCNGNGIPDDCDIVSGFSEDCNNNGIPDECDIISGFSDDLNGNTIPDECEGPADDAYEENDTILDVLAETAVPNDQDVTGLILNDEDWYRVNIGGCDNARITLTFDHAQGDINMQVYDARCLSSGEPIRVGDSYSTTGTESFTYVNNTGQFELFVRVYGEGGATNPNYTLRVDTLAYDDAFEPNSTPPQRADLTFNQLHSDLILKDDDFYRFDVTGLDYIHVTVDHNFNYGQLYFQVLEDDGTYNVINGGASAFYTPNLNTLDLDGIWVQGRTHVVVRVFGANRGTSIYSLLVQPGSVPPVMQPASVGTPPSGARVTLAELAQSSMPSIKAPDDNWEENDTLFDVLAATAVPNNSMVTGLVLDDEDWYRIVLSGCENARITLLYNQGQGDVQGQLYDARCIAFGEAIRIGDAYGTTGTEVMTYVNNTGNTELFLRVYGEGGATNQDYSLLVETLGTDDPYEPNSTPPQVMDLVFDQQYDDLVLKDDDFFRFDVTGINFINVDLSHNFNLGQIYIQVLEDDGTYTVINGGSAANYTPNQNDLTISNVDVTGRTTVVVRVFGANRGANFYDLHVHSSP